VNWDQVAPDFEYDGSLRDIYVLETTASDWQAVLDAIWPSLYFRSFKIDDADSGRPTMAELFNPGTTRRMCLDVGGIVVICHFFGEDEIEFDLDPREVTGQVQLDALADFMILVGRATRSPVILVPENMREAPILRYAPATGQVNWVPPAEPRSIF
jgi:hypothetical protein